MLGQYYYHEIIRKTIIGFGTLFNDIHIRHAGEGGTNHSEIKVPLAYGPSQKFFSKNSTAGRFEQGGSNYYAKNVIWNDKY